MGLSRHSASQPSALWPVNQEVGPYDRGRARRSWESGPKNAMVTPRWAVSRGAPLPGSTQSPRDTASAQPRGLVRAHGDQSLCCPLTFLRPHQWEWGALDVAWSGCGPGCRGFCGICWHRALTVRWCSILPGCPTTTLPSDSSLCGFLGFVAFMSSQLSSPKPGMCEARGKPSGVPGPQQPAHMPSRTSPICVCNGCADGGPVEKRFHPNSRELRLLCLQIPSSRAGASAPPVACCLPRIRKCSEFTVNICVFLSPSLTTLHNFKVVNVVHLHLPPPFFNLLPSF